MKRSLIILLAVAMMASGAFAAVGTVLNDGDTLLNGTIVLHKTGWTINGVAQTFNGLPYELNGDTYIQTGSITIDAGVIIMGFQPNISALIICRDAQIFVNGTASEPVIMTSAEDIATWKGSVVVRATSGTQIPDGSGISGNVVYPVTSITTMGDPKTGTPRIACNEWGCLTILGKGYISSNINQPSNTKYPAATNLDAMEGLRVGNPVGVTTAMVSYGGGNDDDDSGSIHYLSLRYGGRTDVPAKELNGLSLGGVGRGTDISYVEVFSNLDDGIEIWGGTVELDHIVMWNVGDDNLDLDQGWRGKASYGLCVQGLSKAGSARASGSGGGDNIFEMDGAEDSDVQPTTTAVISHFTAIGGLTATDQATAWRDNCHVQFDNCIMMDAGAKLVALDNVSGASDGDHGYGYNNTLSWAESWTTPYTASWDITNVKTGGHPNLQSSPAPGFTQAQLQALYPAQTSGYLCQIANSVFYNNLNSAAYTEAIARGVLADGTTMDATNGAMGNIIKSTSPVTKLVRGLPIAPGFYQNVSYLDPTPVNGVTAGAFSQGSNWLVGWTAASTYGMTAQVGPDFNSDGTVDFVDFSVLANSWLQ